MMMNDSPIPEELELQLSALQEIRNRVRQEINHRRLSGRRYNPDMKDMTDLELNQALNWYLDKIDKLLAPYET